MTNQHKFQSLKIYHQNEIEVISYISIIRERCSIIPQSMVLYRKKCFIADVKTLTEYVSFKNSFLLECESTMNKKYILTSNFFVYIHKWYTRKIINQHPLNNFNFELLWKRNTEKFNSDI